MQIIAHTTRVSCAFTDPTAIYARVRKASVRAAVAPFAKGVFEH